MPSRNLVYEALALRTRESPAGDRILCLMTAEAGIQDVFVFGGPKSKLRSLAGAYSAGRAFVYLDPPRDFRKLTDFEVREPFIGLRESLKKIWSAGLVAEFLIKTSGGGGDFPEVLELSLETLRSLEKLPEERADYPTLLFLWRMIAFIGLMPDSGLCASCGVELVPTVALVHSFAAGGFLCPACSRAEAEGRTFTGEARWAYSEQEVTMEDSHITMTAGAVRWLERASRLSFADAVHASLDIPSLNGLKRLAFALARRAAETPLATLSAGGGIL